MGMRIKWNNAYLYVMKAHLNLTIEERLLVQIKSYAQKNNTNLSELVEGYFKKLVKPANKPNIIDIVEQLERPDIPGDANLKELYYSEQAEKYGF